MIEIIIPSIFILLSFLEFLFKYKHPGKNNVLFKREFCFLFFILYTLIFSLRYKVGVDWYNYETYFLNSLYSNTYEIGFSLVNKIVYSIGFDYWVISFLASTAFIVFFIYRAYKDFDYPIAFLSLFILSSLMNQLETVRLLFALPFLFVALGFLKENNKKYALLSILLGGILFHKTLLIYMPVICFLNVDIKNRVRFYIVFVSFVVAMVIKPFTFELLEIMKDLTVYIKEDRFIFYLNQINMKDIVSPITITYIIKIIAFLSILYFLGDDNKFTIKNKIYLNIGVIYFVVINLLSFFPTIVYRVSDLFIIGFIGSLVAILYLFEDKYVKFFTFTLTFFLVVIIYFRPFSDMYFKINILNYNNYLMYIYNGNDHYKRNIEVKEFWKYE